LIAVESFRSDGQIQMLFTNGQRRSVGQVQLARFEHPRQLQPLPGGRWYATPAAGTPVVGAPGLDGLGVLLGGALEVSAPIDPSATPGVPLSLH
jgi:flagellar hook protein FlgE